MSDCVFVLRGAARRRPMPILQRGRIARNDIQTASFVCAADRPRLCLRLECQVESASASSHFLYALQYHHPPCHTCMSFQCGLFVRYVPLRGYRDFVVLPVRMRWWFEVYTARFYTIPCTRHACSAVVCRLSEFEPCDS